MAPYSQSQKLPRAPDGPDLPALLQSLKAGGHGLAQGLTFGNEAGLAGRLAQLGWAEATANNPELLKLAPGDQRQVQQQIYESVKNRVGASSAASEEQHPLAHSVGRGFAEYSPPTALYDFMEGAPESASDIKSRFEQPDKVMGGIQAAGDIIKGAYPLTGMIPMAGPALKGAGALAKMFPKATASLLGGGALAAGMTPTSAGAEKLTREQQMELNLKKQGGLAEIKGKQEAEAARVKAENERAAAKQAQELSIGAEKEKEERARANKLADEAHTAELSKHEREAPFSEAHPYWNAALYPLGMAASMALPLAAKGVNAGLRRGFAGEWNKSANAALKAVKDQDPVMGRLHMHELQSFKDQADKLGYLPKAEPDMSDKSRLDRIIHTVTTPFHVPHDVPKSLYAASVIAPLEIGQVANEYDAAVLPKGSPNQVAAYERLTDPKEWGTRAMSAIPTGLMGAGFGGHLPFPNQSIARQLARTEGLQQTFGSIPKPLALPKGPAKPKAPPKFKAKEVPAETPGLPEVSPIKQVNPAISEKVFPGAGGLEHNFGAPPHQAHIPVQPGVQSTGVKPPPGSPPVPHEALVEGSGTLVTPKMSPEQFAEHMRTTMGHHAATPGPNPYAFLHEMPPMGGMQ